jgi:hypothetical protein
MDVMGRACGTFGGKEKDVETSVGKRFGKRPLGNSSCRGRIILARMYKK